jgi:hypothetical protein
MRAFGIALLTAPLTFASAHAEQAMEILENACTEKEQVAGPVKCRRHFTSKGYSVQWQGTDTSITHHGLGFEVLTHGDDAVVCWSAMIEVNDRSMCMALERKR